MNLRTDKKKLHATIVLDESGSMDVVRDEMITGLNEYIQDLRSKAEKFDITVTFVKFSGHDQIHPVHIAKPVNEVEDLTREDYTPNGLTAMYDGVAKGLNLLKQNVEDSEDTAYMAIIVSDGAENNSREYDSSKIAEMIKERQDTKRWTITYLGANHDLTQVQQNLGLNNGNIAYYTNSGTGVNTAFGGLRSSTVSYMSKLENAGVDLKSASLDTAFYNDSNSGDIVNISENINTTDK